MLYREITRNDLEEVAELYLKLAQHVKTASQDPYFDLQDRPRTEMMSSFEADLKNPEKVTYVAVPEKSTDKIAGFISGEIINCYLPLSKVRKVGYIESAYSLPEYRKVGIMKSLEECINRFFKAKGVSFVELHVMLKNQIARDFWESRGYKTFRVHLRKKI